MRRVHLIGDASAESSACTPQLISNERERHRAGVLGQVSRLAGHGSASGSTQRLHGAPASHSGTLKAMDSRGDDAEADHFDEFFDDRLLFRPSGTTSGSRPPRSRPPYLRPARSRLPARPVDRVDRFVALSLVLVSVAGAALMRSSSHGLQDEILESPLFPWTWLLSPALCLAASLARPFESRPLWWVLCLFGPWVAVVAVEGFVLFDPFRGASFWGWYAMVLVAQGALCWLVGGVAALAASSRSRGSLKLD